MYASVMNRWLVKSLRAVSAQQTLNNGCHSDHSVVLNSAYGNSASYCLAELQCVSVCLWLAVETEQRRDARDRYQQWSHLSILWPGHQHGLLVWQGLSPSVSLSLSVSPSLYQFLLALHHMMLNLWILWI